MITGNDIQALVDLFEERQVFLYHACQLIDFESYISLGGIPSRALLKSRQVEFTPFQTDDTDRENNMWDKVFVNLSDFGSSFAKGSESVPNPYGPILFKLCPTALLEASDVAVCLWSAGAKGFNRERESLNTLEDIDRLFLHPSNSGNPKSTHIKYRARLAEEFGRQKTKTQDPEISCIVPNGVLSTQHVSFIRVDPYIVNNQKLLDWVNIIKQRYSVQFPVYERSHFPERSRSSFYNEIAEQIGEQIPTLQALALNNACSQSLRDWAEQIFHLEWLFERYASYLRHGTLKPMREGVTPRNH